MQQITNIAIITQIENAYKQFTASKKSLEDFFSVSIMYATRRRTDKFNLKSTKIKFDRVIIVFGGSKEDEYYLGEDFGKLQSLTPIQIKAETLFALLGKPPLGTKPLELSNCTIFKLKKVKDRNGKEVIRGHKHYEIPGGRADSDVNIGVWEWNSDGDNILFWLPSDNLLENVFTCSKTPSCGYTCSNKQVIFIFFLLKLKLI